MRKYYKPWWQRCNAEKCAARPIEQVKEHLFKAYSNAILVEEVDGQLKAITVSSFNTSQLVYLKKSPNFCNRNKTYGIEGTSGRQCFPDKMDSSSCDNLCCGSSIETRIEEKFTPCKCRFVWCCHVKCETCSDTVTSYYCK